MINYILKKTNNYKYGIIVFSILLSGCTTTENFKFKTECTKNPNNYLNESLTTEYEKEKKFYAIEDKPDACAYSQRCTILEKEIKWESVQIFLIHKEGLFPNKSGFYEMYRDYSLSKCLSNYRGSYTNEYINKKGKFCIAANEITKPNSKIIFKYKTFKKNDSRYITKIDTEIIYNNNKYLSVVELLFSTPSSSDYCASEDKSYYIILNQFN